MPVDDGPDSAQKSEEKGNADKFVFKAQGRNFFHDSRQLRFQTICRIETNSEPWKTFVHKFRRVKPRIKAFISPDPAGRIAGKSGRKENKTRERAVQNYSRREIEKHLEIRTAMNGTVKESEVHKNTLALLIGGALVALFIPSSGSQASAIKTCEVPARVLKVLRAPGGETRRWTLKVRLLDNAKFVRGHSAGRNCYMRKNEVLTLKASLQGRSPGKKTRQAVKAGEDIILLKRTVFNPRRRPGKFVSWKIMGRTQSVASCKKPKYCRSIYSPVCGANGRTYGNLCEARRKCVVVAYKGKCKVSSGKRRCQRANVYCPAVYDPVCGDDGKTYSNSCRASANCVGWRPGRCKSKGGPGRKE